MSRPAPAAPDTPEMASVPISSRSRPGRLSGLDALRALAILGMVYVHISPGGWLNPTTETPALLAWIEDAVTSRAMSLFVLMAGVSVALMTGGPSPVEGPKLRSTRWRLAIRAGVLFLISLLVDQLSGMNLSILAYYALWMLLLIPLVRLSPKALLTAAAVAGVILPIFCFVVLNYGRNWVISPFNGDGQSAVGLMLLLHPQDWLANLKGLLIGGGFQTPYAIPLLLAGLAIGRLDLRSHVVRRRLAVTGFLLVGTSWFVSRLALGPLGVEQALAEVFAGDPPFLQPWGSVLTLPPHQLYAMSVPMAPFMLGIGLLMLSGLLTLLERPIWRRKLLPLTAAGRLALTWYAAHLVFLKRVMGDSSDTFILFAGISVFVLVLSPLWLRWFSRGPLEWLMYRASLLATLFDKSATKARTTT